MINIFDTKHLKFFKHKFFFTWVEQGIAKKDLRVVQRWGKHLKNELKAEHFEQWMNQFPGLDFSPCIIALFYFADKPTQKSVFETAAKHQRNFYCEAWSNIVREEFLASLLRWHHNDIIARVLDRYDPTFLTWIGLRFNRPDIYEKSYPLSDHDCVQKMLEERVFEEQERIYWNLDYYRNQRDQNFAILNQLQREKLQALVGDLGETKRRKL